MGQTVLVTVLERSSPTTIPAPATTMVAGAIPIAGTQARSRPSGITLRAAAAGERSHPLVISIRRIRIRPNNAMSPNELTPACDNPVRQRTPRAEAGGLDSRWGAGARMGYATPIGGPARLHPPTKRRVHSHS